MRWRDCTSIVCLTTALLAATPARSDSNTHTLPDLDGWQAFVADTRTPKVVSRLGVNANTEQRLVVPNKCREAGESELQELAQHARIEESFVYIPSHCLWLEVGYDETPTRVRLDTAFVALVLRNAPSITIYHIHVGVRDELAGFFPAYSDLVGLVLMNVRFIDEPTVAIRHRAVNTFGTIDYAFEATMDIRNLMDNMKTNGLGRYMAQNLAYIMSGRQQAQTYFDKVEECRRKARSASVPITSCFPFVAASFRLNFHPAGMTPALSSR